MLVQTAIQLVNEIQYFPGWTFTATDHSRRFEGAILVRIDYTAQETGRENAERGYPETIQTYATFPVVVVDCDNLALFRKVANAIMRIQEHEMREALRIRPSYWAPFHPHNMDGMRRWNATSGCTDADIMGDIQFGIG